MSSSDTYQTGLYILEEIPTLFIISLHSEQLLKWGTSYFTAGGKVDEYKHFMHRVIIGNVLLYVSQVVIWVAYDRTQKIIDTDIWSLVAAVIHMLAVFVVAVQLVRYGVRLRRTVQSVPTNLAMRMKQMRTVTAVVAVCTVAFIIRTVALMAASWATFTDVGGFDEQSTGADTAMTILFFLVTEFIPLVMLLWQYGASPKKRGKAARSGTGSRPLVKRLSVSNALKSMRFAFSPAAAAVPRTPGTTGKDTTGDRTPVRSLSIMFRLPQRTPAAAESERTPLTAAMRTPGRAGATASSAEDDPEPLTSPEASRSVQAGSSGVASPDVYSPVSLSMTSALDSPAEGYQAGVDGGDRSHASGQTSSRGAAAATPQGDEDLL